MRGRNNVPAVLTALCLLLSGAYAAAAEAPSLAALRKSVREGDTAARFKAVDGLTLLGGEAAAAELKAAAKADPDAAVREAAILAVCELLKREAASVLLAGLEDPDEGVRLLSMRMIGKFATEEAAPKLVGALRGASVPVKAVILDALGKIGSAGALAAVDTEARTARDGRVKAAAVRAVGRILAVRVAGLKSRLKDKDAAVRAAAARALAGIGSGAGLAVSLELLGHKDRELRRQAARALGEMGAAGAVPALERALRAEGNASVVAALRLALSRIRSAGRKDERRAR